MGPRTRGRPEPEISVARSVADVLRDHVAASLKSRSRSVRGDIAARPDRRVFFRLASQRGWRASTPKRDRAIGNYCSSVSGPAPGLGVVVRTDSYSVTRTTPGTGSSITSMIVFSTTGTSIMSWRFSWCHSWRGLRWPLSSARPDLCGLRLEAHGSQSPEMATAVKPSRQPRTESCVMTGNGHCEA